VDEESTQTSEDVLQRSAERLSQTLLLSLPLVGPLMLLQQQQLQVRRRRRNTAQ
jgi:hypothetical protein